MNVALHVRTEEYLKGLEEASKPLYEWLRKQGHPHTSIYLDQNGVTVSEGRAFIRYENAETGSH